MSENNTLYIVDGSAYIYRAFYAVRRLSNSKGFPTNALYGFVNMLKKLIEQENPTHLAMTFDRYDEEDEGRSFRHEIYSEYKANRDAMPDDLRVQVPFFIKIVEALTIPVLVKSKVEADDVIATVTRRALEEDLDVCIVSADKDLMQLLTDRVRMIDTMRNKTFTPEEAVERFGVEPERIKYVLALAGDTSDNVPGVPGIGEKTGGNLIKEFGDLENLLANIDKVSGKKRKENLTNFADQARMSLDLVTLKDDVEIDFDIEALALTPPDLNALTVVMEELEFHSMHRALLRWFDDRGLLPEPTPNEDVHGQQLLFGASASSAQKDNKPIVAAPSQKTYHTVLTREQFKEVLENLTQAERFAFDLETTNLDPLGAEIVGVALSWEEHTGVYIPVGHTYDGAPLQLERQEVLDALKPYLESDKRKVICQNVKYEWLVLQRYNINFTASLYDTMLMSYLLDPGKNSHGLDAIAKTLLGYETISYTDVAGKGKKQVTFDQVLIEMATDYAAEDADIALMACNRMEPMLKEQNLLELYEQMEHPLIFVLADMERNGIHVASDVLADLSVEFEQELEVLQAEIDAYAPEVGQSINPNSPKQLREVLFEHLDLPIKKQTKSGPSTDQSVLEQLASLHPLPDLILEFRKFSKLKSTYVDALPSLMRADTHRVHTNFNQAVTATGRLSSSEPNLQNIPIRTDRGKRIRETFIPKDGWVLLAADYSQIELRILSHMSEDQVMIEAYQNNADIHALTASNIFDIPIEEVQPDQRRVGKTINFGVIYGMGASRLANSLKISHTQAKKYIENYFERYAGVAAYFDEVVTGARRTGEVQTLFGRKRLIPEINASGGQRAFAERVATNTPIQGTAADIIKKAMLALHNTIPQQNLQLNMLLQVHDELVFEVAPDDLEASKALIVELMENVCELHVPLKVDVGVGENWLYAK